MEECKIEVENTLGELNTIYQFKNMKSKAIIIHLVINGVSIPMEVDTGTSLSVINKYVLISLKREIIISC